MFTLIDEKLQDSLKSPLTVISQINSGCKTPVITPASRPAPVGPLTSYASTVGQGGDTVIQRNRSGEARAKRIYSIVENNEIKDTDEEGWELAALLPSSWKTGWAVKPCFFRRKRPDRQQHQGGEPLAQLSAQVGHGGHLRHDVHP